MSGDNAKRRENVTRLEWQGELDSHLLDLDSRLRHPRRRSTDSDRQPQLPDLSRVEMTSELLDEIAWRVAEQIRRSRQAPEHAGSGPPPLASEASADSAEPALKPGKMLLIRYQVPRLPWPFRLLQRRRRRREHPLTTAKVRV